eukprot:1157650-Pelagomonas_calceolata.AAC.9
MEAGLLRFQQAQLWALCALGAGCVLWPQQVGLGWGCLPRGFASICLHAFLMYKERQAFPFTSPPFLDRVLSLVSIGRPALLHPVKRGVDAWSNCLYLCMLPSTSIKRTDLPGALQFNHALVHVIGGAHSHRCCKQKGNNCKLFLQISAMCGSSFLRVFTQSNTHMRHNPVMRAGKARGDNANVQG